jgi:hypothetical protein
VLGGNFTPLGAVFDVSFFARFSSQNGPGVA